MKAAATSQALRESIRQHHTETESQIERLEEVFELVGEQPSKKQCDAIIGILKEGEKLVQDTQDDTMVRDAAIIIAAQKVEHYEIASYGSLAELARTLGLEDAAAMLEETLEEEKSTDVGLTELAVESVNEEAKEEGILEGDTEFSGREGQVNDFQQAQKHGDFRQGDSDSEYPAAQPEDRERERRERMQEGYTTPDEKKDLSDNNISSNDPTEGLIGDNTDDDYRGLTRESR